MPGTHILCRFCTVYSMAKCLLNTLLQYLCKISPLAKNLNMTWQLKESKFQICPLLRTITQRAFCIAGRTDYGECTNGCAKSGEANSSNFFRCSIPSENHPLAHNHQSWWSTDNLLSHLWTWKTNFCQMSYNLPEDGDKLRWKMKKCEDEIWIIKPPGLIVTLIVKHLDCKTSRGLLWKRDQASDPSKGMIMIF